MNPPILLLKVTLRHTLPRVWRRLIVPRDITLARFHFVIQASIGWPNITEHHFEDADGRIYSPNRSRPVRRLGYNAKLMALLSQVGTHATYHSGFEEDWEHDLKLEGFVEGSPRKYPIRCVGGEGPCPPEACGGPLGFDDLLRDRGIRAFSYGKFEASAFKLRAVNAALRRLKR